MSRFDFHAPISAFQLLQAAVLSIGLLFTVVQLRRSARAARATNLLELVKNHRELWMYALEHEELRQLINPEFVVSAPAKLSDRQRHFVNFLLLHMATAYELSRINLLTKNRATRLDIGSLLSLPSFRASWSELQRFHTRRFRWYANRAIRASDRRSSLGTDGGLLHMRTDSFVQETKPVIRTRRPFRSIVFRVFGRQNSG